MKGLELSEKFYLTYGKDAIEQQFSQVSSKIAVGLVGEGSECFGFDDDISADHDFEPGFCLWLTREDYDAFGFKLERMYANLPKEFEGYSRQPFSPVGGNRHGVFVIDDFYTKFLGSPSAPVSLEHWLAIPHETLATATNGKVFCDELGKFSAIRNELLKGYPEDVRLKKISAHTIMMVQSGLYNYNRAILRGENGTAQLCVFEFVKHAISLIYLLNNAYEPFYKWSYKAMRNLEILCDLETPLVALTELGNSSAEADAKSQSVEEICIAFSEEFKKQNLISSTQDAFEKQAFTIQNKISNSHLRNMHIMDGI